MSERIAIYHEHPDWFRPLFAELERRQVPFLKLDAGVHSYDPSERRREHSKVTFQGTVDGRLRRTAFVVERPPGRPVHFIETDVLQDFVELGSQQADDGLLPLYPGLLSVFEQTEHDRRPPGVPADKLRRFRPVRQ